MKTKLSILLTFTCLFSAPVLSQEIVLTKELPVYLKIYDHSSFLPGAYSPSAKEFILTTHNEAGKSKADILIISCSVKKSELNLTTTPLTKEEAQKTPDSSIWHFQSNSKCLGFVEAIRQVLPASLKLQYNAETKEILKIEITH